MPEPPTIPDPPDPSVPRERFLIVYWDVEDQRWAMAGDWEDRDEAHRWREVWRQELGQRRVRILHTADEAA